MNTFVPKCKSPIKGKLQVLAFTPKCRSPPNGKLTSHRSNSAQWTSGMCSQRSGSVHLAEFMVVVRKLSNFYNALQRRVGGMLFCKKV